MATKIKVGIITKLPFSTQEEVNNFVDTLHKEGFFSDKDAKMYFTQQINEDWYLDYKSSSSEFDPTTENETVSFDMEKVVNECYEIEDILLSMEIATKLNSKCYVFVGEYEMYGNVVSENSTVEEGN